MKIFAYENFGYEGNLIAVESEIKRGISKSVKNAADVQRSMDTINRTSNEKLSLADYEFGR